MSAADDIDELLNSGIDIMGREINILKNAAELDKASIERLCDLLKVLVLIRKDWRITDDKDIINVKKLKHEEFDKTYKETVVEAYRKIMEENNE